LDGRTEDGKTIYKNEDMTLHQHKQQSAQQATVSTTTQHVTQSATKDYPPILNVLSAKVDRIIALLEKLEKERV
jgi:hypothetical protein